MPGQLLADLVTGKPQHVDGLLVTPAEAVANALVEWLPSLRPWSLVTLHMRWAGALDGIMQTFAADFAAQPLTLYQNFRSAPVLRRMQNRMVEVMDPAAAVPIAELVGDDGRIEVMPFANVWDEAGVIADRIEAWLDEGVPPSEIAVLVRQQPHLVCQHLVGELTARGIASRNEQVRQDLTAEPAAALILNLIRVLADDRRSASYEHLMRFITRTSLTGEMALRTARRVTRFLTAKRQQLRDGTDARSSSEEWTTVVTEFLQLVTR